MFLLKCRDSTGFFAEFHHKLLHRNFVPFFKKCFPSNLALIHWKIGFLVIPRSDWRILFLNIKPKAFTVSTKKSTFIFSAPLFKLCLAFNNVQYLFHSGHSIKIPQITLSTFPPHYTGGSYNTCNFIVLAGI